MKISENGINLIKRWESFRSKAYKCPVGVWTQGYGHTRTVSAHSQDITEYTAEAFLKTDLYMIEMSLKKYIKDIDLNQNQYDAIVSFCFNLGLGSFINSTAYKVMQDDCDSKFVADSWIQYRNGGGKFLRGLILRRLDELKLYYS